MQKAHTQHSMWATNAKYLHNIEHTQFSPATSFWIIQLCPLIYNTFARMRSPQCTQDRWEYRTSVLQIETFTQFIIHHDMHKIWRDVTLITTMCAGRLTPHASVAVHTRTCKNKGLNIQKHPCNFAMWQLKSTITLMLASICHLNKNRGENQCGTWFQCISV